MWLLTVVVQPPSFDIFRCFLKRREQRLIQALIPQPPVEAFDEAVLLRLARLDVVSGHTRRQLPAQHRPRGEFRAVSAGGRTVGGTELLRS